MEKVFLCVFVLATCAYGEVIQSEDGSSGTIRMSPPDLNDEESHSVHMPLHLKCDACTAIVYLITKSFDAAHNKKKSVKRLPESDVYDIFEDICTGSGIEKYGVKEVKKVKRLSGPGLETEQEPGIMAGGGRWPERMKRLCNQYIEEFDEENIYQQYLKKGDNLFNFLCQSSAHPYLTDVCIKDNQTKVKTEL